MKEELHHITLLFEKRDREGLTPDEEKVLLDWVAQAPEERTSDLKKTQHPTDWLPEIRDALIVMERAEELEAENRKRVLKLIREQSAAERAGKPAHKMRYWYRAAAAAVVLISSALLFLYQPQKRSAIVGAVRPVDSSKLLQRAVLSISDFEEYRLNPGKDGIVLRQGGTRIVKQGNSIRYQPESDTLLAHQHRLVIPKGCQYMVTLPDQTTVWLNAGSTLEFPTAFTGKDRSVTLSGEAFFDVSHNPAKPFIVKYGRMEVEVKGTKFNINGYDPGRLISTLVEGSVKVRRGREFRMLKPGEQSIIAGDAPIAVEVADLDNVLAWRSGRFFFNNQSLESITETLSRWYDIKVIFDAPVPDVYSGAFTRDMPIEKVFSVLQANGGFSFKMDEDNVIRISRP